MLVSLLLNSNVFFLFLATNINTKATTNTNHTYHTHYANTYFHNTKSAVPAVMRLLYNRSIYTVAY